MIIRRMEHRDKDAVIDLALEFGRTRLEQSGMCIDRESASEQFDLFVGMDNVLALVADDNGSVDGMIVCFVSPLVFTKQIVAQEVVWYVRESKRACGVRLLKKLEYLLIEMGCSSILMVGLEGDRSCDFYERFGYTLFQKTYIKKVV